MGFDDDRQLVLQVQRGDSAAFEALARRHYGLVYAICLQETSNPVDAEDLAQEAFVRAHRDLGKLRDPAKFVPWMRRLTRNLCRMAARRQRPAETGSGVEAVEELAILRIDLGRLLAQLSETTRVPLSLHYFGGHSYKDIAASLDVPERTVRSRLHEGRKQLRSRLREVARELLELDGRSGRAVEGILERCRGAHCVCSARLVREGWPPARSGADSNDRREGVNQVAGKAKKPAQTKKREKPTSCDCGCDDKSRRK